MLYTEETALYSEIHTNTGECQDCPSAPSCRVAFSECYGKKARNCAALDHNKGQ